MHRAASARSRRGWMAWLVAGMTIAVGLGLVACTSTPAPTAAPSGGAGSTPTQTPSLPPLNGTYDPLTDPTVMVVQSVAPAVVNVTTRILSQNDLVGGSAGSAVGTGFIIRSDGFIVTNFHVIEGALSIKVTLPPPDNRTFQAHWVGGDPDHDLAVLQVAGSDLPVVPLGSSSALKLGERVIALGYALALPGGPTVTSGIISSLQRTVQASDPNTESGTRTYQDVLQTDAAINPGNSGGPLVDLAGNVVGINTAGSGSAENVGFSIAIDAAKPVIDRAIAHPAAPAPYLGVSTTTVGPGVKVQFGLPVDHGALVLQVAPEGPADKAGVREGDVIVSFGGEAVTSSDQLGALVLDHEPGDEVSLKVTHADGTSSVLTATLTTRPGPVAP